MVYVMPDKTAQWRSAKLPIIESSWMPIGWPSALGAHRMPIGCLSGTYRIAIGWPSAIGIGYRYLYLSDIDTYRAPIGYRLSDAGPYRVPIGLPAIGYLSGT